MGKIFARVGTAVLTLLIGWTPVWAQNDINLASSEQFWRGVSAGASAGTWLDQGAMNSSDQRRDLIVGSPGDGGSVPGRVHIIFGGPVRSGEQSLSSDDVTITGNAGDRFGAATAAGNIKTTEASGSARDLVVGAPNANSGGGAIYLFNSFASGVNKTIGANAVLTINGAAGEQFGSALATADLNGDGFREIIVLAPGSNRIYIYNGSAGMSGTFASSAATIIVSGRAFRSMAAGDVNNDDKTDLLVGAPGENGSTGEIYVLFGQTGGFPSNLVLPAAAGVNVVTRFDGVNPGDLAGTSIALGDFDSDDFRDIFIGAPGADPLGRTNAGAVYLIYSAATIPSRSLASAPAMFAGELAGNLTGTLLVTGDINRDTPNDLVMLASGARGGTGELHVYYGGARANRSGTIDLAAGMSRRMFADPAAGAITSATVFEVTGEGARDVIAGVPAADGGPGSDSGLLYFSISPKLILNTTSVSGKAAQGSISSMTAQVTNPGVFVVTWTATTNASWLSVSPASGEASAGAPGVLNIRGNAAGLAPGVYTGQVTIRSTSLHLTMTLTVRACSQSGRTYGDFTGDGCADLAVFHPLSGTWFVQDGPSTVWGNATDVLVPGDYNGDGRADIAVFRPSTGTWYINNVRTVVFGRAGDRPVPADYDGNGTTDVAVFRPSTGQWFIENQGTTTWGRTGDTPVPADYNGDGRADIAVFRRSTGRWYFATGGSAEWGRAGDLPVPADYNGDNRDDVAIFRPSTGEWMVMNQFTYTWGMAGDIPIPLDRNGDNSADLVVYRPSTAAWYIKVRATDTTELETTFGSTANVPALTPPKIGTLVDGDMDADRKAEVAIFKPSNGDWYNLLSSSNFTSYTRFTWGLNGDVPVTADFDADGRSDIAVFRPSTGRWWILNSSTNNTTYTPIDWGLDGDIPVPGDYLGAGYAQVVVYRPGAAARWYIRGGPYIDFGTTNDVPAPADYDGDGRMDIAVFRPSTGIFYVKLSSREFASYITTTWGAAGDVPVPADYDGDGKADYAVRRPSNGTWYITFSSTGYTDGMTLFWGSQSTDVPVPADYNGDGKVDIAIWRPSLGRFYIYNVMTVDWGLNGDIPVLNR